ncbi:sugar-binding domain-containing protein [Mariniluteicoccus endophyticus]
MARDVDLHRAATLYYVQDETMESIAHHLGVSRSSVSRLLKEARERGIVQISVGEPDRSADVVGRRLAERFGVRAHVVPVRDGTPELARVDKVCLTAARLVSEWVADDLVVGLAWGTTISSLVQHLVPRRTSGVTVVQMNGAVNPTSSGIPHAGAILSAAADAFGATAVHFPVPAFFDHTATKQAMWAERSVRRVLAVQRKIGLAVFGVGALGGTVPSHVYASGYLSPTDVAELRRQRVVGDVCTVLLREDGSWDDIELNQRATGLNPAELQRVPRRVCVVAGEAKVPALVAALHAHVATDLVVDEATAHAVLRRGEA